MTAINSRPIVVTGAAGFIGAALCLRLLQRGDRVIGIDNLNTYYDPALKQARLKGIEAMTPSGAWHFEQIALEEGEALLALFAAERPRVVVNLAAQAGVRYSLENPAAYIQSNLVGFGHILEGCRHLGVENLVYASSSSVYGGNRNLPFDERQPVNHPVSLYRPRGLSSREWLPIRRNQHRCRSHRRTDPQRKELPFHLQWPQARGKDAFGPAASPGHSRCAIRAIGNTTVGIWGFFPLIE